MSKDKTLVSISGIIPGNPTISCKNILRGVLLPKCSVIQSQKFLMYTEFREDCVHAFTKDTSLKET